MNESLKTWGPYLVAAVMAFAAVKYTSAQNTKELDKQDEKIHLMILEDSTLKTNVATTATKVEDIGKKVNKIENKVDGFGKTAAKVEGIEKDVGKIEKDVDKIEAKVDDILKILMRRG